MEKNTENMKPSVAPTINSDSSSTESSFQKRKINFKDELIFLFYNSMLELIVDSWESEELNEVESVPSGSTIIYSKPYTEIVDEDLQTASFISVEGSNISLMKRSENSLRKNTSDFTNSKQKKRLNKKSQNSMTKSFVIDKKIKKSTNKGQSTDYMESIEHQKEDTCSSISWFVHCTDDNVVIQFKNGNMYEGHLSRKLMDGQGLFTWADGTKYTGEFCKGKITGKGSMHFPDLSYYTGEFYNGYRHGFGSMIMAESPQIYSGHWHCGQRNGRGWMLFAPGDWYDGDWKNGLMHGHGMRRYASGGMYYGEWKNGFRHGQGVAVLKNSDFYSGNWAEGKRAGYGEYIWKAFLNQTFSFPAENKYFGSWDNDLMHGVGVMNFGTGSGAKYAGCYDKNKKHGPGVIVCENGVSYEANPLFINDKTVQSTELKLDAPETISTSPNIEKHVKKKCNHPNALSGSADNLLKLRRTLGFSTLGLVSKQIETKVPCSTLDVTTLAHINMCKLTFPEKKATIFTQNIPINAPDDNINLTHYIDKVIEKYHNLVMNSDSTFRSEEHSADSISNKIFPAVKHSSTKSSDSPVYRKTLTSTDMVFDKEVLSAMEEKLLRKAIIHHLPKLRSIYHQYASVANLKGLLFNGHMCRLFLWQMYQDCKIPTCKNVSLAEADEILAENCATEINKKHNPFEQIYFWQFLHSLISLACRLYADECVHCIHEGILKTAFNKFLENDIFPNVGKHSGNVLFTYGDLLPINNVYQWYQTFEEPPSVLEFMQHACCIEKCGHTPCFTKKIKKFLDIDGKNIVPVGRNLLYLEDDSNNASQPKYKEIDKLLTLPSCCKLAFLHTLNATTIFNCVKTILPHIIQENEIVNINYPLVFIEFYELVLMCAQKVVDQERKRAEEAKIIAETIRLELVHEETESVAEDLVAERKPRRSGKAVIKKKKSTNI